MPGTYPKVIQALAAALLHHGHRMTTLADTSSGGSIESRRIIAWMLGTFRFEFRIDGATPDWPETCVEASSAFDGSPRDWGQGRRMLDGVLDDTERLLKALSGNYRYAMVGG